jgi:hypothetical protein
MKHVAINDAFRRLVDGGLSAEQAWRKLSDAGMSGDLQLWCNGNPVALDYLNANVRFIIRNGDFIAWTAGGGLGFNPFEYTFTIDDAELERLSLPPDRRDLRDLTLREAQRREREGLIVNAGVLYRWLFDTHRTKVSLPDPRTVRIWVKTWRDEQKLAPAKRK